MHRRILVVLGFLFSLTFAAPADEPKFQRLPLAEKDLQGMLQADHYGLYLLGKKIGWAKFGLSRQEDAGGARYASSLEMELKLFAAGARTETKIAEIEEFDGRPPFAFRGGFSRESDGKSVKEVRVTKADNGFEVTIDESGEKTSKRMAAMDYTLADYEAAGLWIRTRPKVGDQIVVRSFDFDEMRIDPEIYTFKQTKNTVANGVKVIYHELELKLPKEGLTGRLRVDDGGDRLYSMTFGGLFELRMEPEAVAKKTEFSSDLFELGKVKIDKKLGDESTITGLVLETVGKRELQLKSGPRQAVSRNASGAYTLKLGKAHGQPSKATAQEIADGLAETSEYPVNHAKIQALAKTAVGDAKTPEEKLRRLVGFVSQFITPNYSAEPLTIMDLLKNRQGDCKHYARLLTVLARAVGIPTRDVTGLVYAGDDEQAFGLHAWNEVVLDGHWTPVDASCGQTEIDATHINFGTVVDDQMANLYAAFGKLAFRVVEVKREAAKP
jgi:hypothetical protein